MASTEQTNSRGRVWSITINNPSQDDDDAMMAARLQPWVVSLEGQKEKGENGTEHYQLMLKTQTVRFSQVKKAFPRAHIELARNEKALANYVHKDETRVAAISTTKVATQRDCQERITDLVEIKMFQSHLIPVEEKETWRVKTRKERADTLLMYIQSEDTAYMEKMNWKVKRGSYYETLVDDMVKDLILQGFYGVEFVMSNNQVRNAFIKYLPQIVYRTYNARQDEVEHEAQGQTHEQEEGGSQEGQL